MAKKRRPRRMTELSLDRFSGVDHPAHLEEGWMVLKSIDLEDLFEDAEVVHPRSRPKRPEPKAKGRDTGAERLLKDPAFRRAILLNYLSTVAKERAASSGRPWEQEYQAVLKTEEGRRMYDLVRKTERELSSLPRLDGAPLAKALGTKTSLGEHIERRAAETFPDVTKAAAVDRFLDTPEGRRLYDEYMNAV